MLVPNFNRLFIMIAVIGLIAGIVLANLVPWIWSFVKPLIHSITG